VTSFWTGFEKRAMVPSLNPVRAAGATVMGGVRRVGRFLAGTPNGQKALGGLERAKIYGKGAVMGAAVGAGGMATAHAMRAANQGAMVPVQQQQY